MKEKTKVYKRYVFRYLYGQWVNDILRATKTWKEAKEYVDNLKNKQNRREVNNK